MKGILKTAKNPDSMDSIMRIDISLRRLLLPFFSEMPASMGQSIDRMNGFSRVISFMEQNIDRDLTIPELAKLAGMSQNEFSASFREAFGIPPKQYLTRRRVDASRVLLMKDGMSIKEIAAKVGYGNEFFFYRIFKKCVGITPDAYRRRRNICRRTFPNLL